MRGYYRDLENLYYFGKVSSVTFERLYNDYIYYYRTYSISDILKINAKHNAGLRRCIVLGPTTPQEINDFELVRAVA